MNITLILFLIGILGFVLNRKNIILMLISIEIMLLAITFLILVSSLNIDDIIGKTYAIYIIAVAGAESAIGLGILVAFYRLNSSLNITCISLSLETYSKKIFNSYAHYSSRPAVFLLDPCQGQAKKTIYLSKKIRARSYSTKAFNENVNIPVLSLRAPTSAMADSRGALGSGKIVGVKGSILVP